ncbi:MAG: hypothetical protein BSOLF_0347 [Candidatus Carbobacillus altaicus]|uniref:Uncharacterized protein n=1 Tax=Candidatus Carbonibacillus altaicus TaxID=2163959 RepID=A0A2R6Y0Z9_9BACL|nr:MAG: hypothetical protein BSOLF_0347 [Candidatus Carbobacillus altaicus]
MLWQIDASPYAWLEDRDTELTLHGIIDDATAAIHTTRAKIPPNHGGIFSRSQY